MSDRPVDRLRRQRDQAAACAGLALAVAAATLISNFSGDRFQLKAVGRAIEEHRRILAAEEREGEANRRALEAARTALAPVR